MCCVFKGYNIGSNGFSGQFFCFIVAIFDLVHDVEAIFCHS